MEPRIRSRTYARFRWSHRTALHRRATRIYNAVMGVVPYTVKYGLGTRLRRRLPPYCFVGPGDVVVQVGAPKDTLAAGRQRAMHFARIVGRTGRVLAVEPDAASCEAARAVAAAHHVDQLLMHAGAAWSEPTTLVVHIDDRHPATNFTETRADYSEADRRAFRRVEMAAEPLDDLADRYALGPVTLVSITTNGAERDILGGMTRMIAAGLPYICVARTSELDTFEPVLVELGYRFVSHDDRGYTFHRV